MLKRIKFYIDLPLGVFSKLSKKRKKQFPFILILMTLTGFVEAITLTSFIPFLYLLVDPQKIIQNNFFKKLFTLFRISNYQDIVLAIFILFLTVLILNGIARCINLWVLNRYSAIVGNEISTKAYKHILYRPYHVQINDNSSKIVASISQRVNNTVQSIYGYLQVASGIISILGILIGLLFTNWIIAISSFLLIVIPYVIINKFSSQKLKKNSKEVVQRNNSQVKMIQECLGSTREIFLGKLQKEFLVGYQKNDSRMRYVLANNNYLTVFPKFLIESFGLIVISFFAFIIAVQNKNPNIIPLLGTFALGAQRLLPLFQQVYSNIAMIFAFSEDLSLVEKIIQDNQYSITKKKGPSIKFKSLRFEKIYFKYENSSKYSIKNLNLEINSGEKIGILGKTGCGKSTLVDLIMGLLKPSKGNYYINQKLIKNKRIDYEKNFLTLLGEIAHVPQTIFLADRSIEENIALGISVEKIDPDKIKHVSFLACADEFIENLPQQYKSNIGENGVRLSGGQRQRIGIARALYRSPELLILDEATSALDTKTEYTVMSRIFEKCDKITVITISHNIKTLINSSRIIEINNGEIIKDTLPQNVINN